jgi:hypothetical protein
MKQRAGPGAIPDEEIHRSSSYLIDSSTTISMDISRHQTPRHTMSSFREEAYSAHVRKL